METSLLDLALPGEYSHFRKSWMRMQMSQRVEPPKRLSMEQLALLAAGLPMPLGTAMDTLNLRGDADDDPGNRDFEAHPLQNSLNDALVWPKWKTIREIIKAHHISDMTGKDDSQPNFPHSLTGGSCMRNSFLGEVGQELAFDVVNLVNGRRIFVSEDGGRMGVAPAAPSVGDVLCIVFGLPTPLVLRPLGGRNTGNKLGNTRYLLIGGCYANGLMEKHAIDKVRARRMKVAGSGVHTIRGGKTYRRRRID